MYPWHGTTEPLTLQSFLIIIINIIFTIIILFRQACIVISTKGYKQSFTHDPTNSATYLIATSAWKKIDVVQL